MDGVGMGSQELRTVLEGPFRRRSQTSYTALAEVKIFVDISTKQQIRTLAEVVPDLGPDTTGDSAAPHSHAVCW